MAGRRGQARRPALIESLSGILTLSPRDVILTGTPKRSVDVPVGQEIACEVDCVGRLMNTLVEDRVPAPLR